MNIDEIRKLVDIIKENELTEFELDEGDFSIRIRRGGEGIPGVIHPAHHYASPMIPASHPSGLSAHAPAAGERAAPKAEEGVEIIPSPMVGTFYRAPSPDSKPFVTEGDKVTPETVICIIEAMKVMNEIQAETKGTILEVLLEDGDVVEFGQPLFKVKKG